jgi:hypothetical protein
LSKFCRKLAPGPWVGEERLDPTKKKKQDYAKPISFVGRDAVGIQTLASTLMEVVYPPDEREDDHDDDVRKKYEKGMEVRCGMCGLTCGGF